MGLVSKILWSEGLTLGPQQFQQQDRYHEMRLQRMASALNVHLWGVRTLAWNDEALANDMLAADAMSLIFQDGDIIEAPASCALPVPFALARLPLDQQAFTFYAALPGLKAHGGNLAPGARYARGELETPDLFSGAASIDVAFLKSGVCLLSELDARDAYVSFPVARVRRVPSGGFEFDPAFIPPCIALGATRALPQLIDQLIGKLSARIESLHAVHRQSKRHTFEVHSGDLASFWMLHTVSSAAAALLHCARARHQHPELLFEKLMALAGALMTFSNKYGLLDLPAYRHDDPGPAFAGIDAIIRDLLDTVISSRYATIALVMDPKRSTHYHARLEAARMGPLTELCLAVNADMPALELVAAVPLLFKIASSDEIERIVVSALPGAGLMHLAQVPSAVPVRPNTCYFAINSRSPLYDNMLKAQALAIYVPSGIKSLKLELLAIEQ